MLLTMLEGLQWEPKQNNRVEQAIQTMNPENLWEKKNPWEPFTTNQHPEL